MRVLPCMKMPIFEYQCQTCEEKFEEYVIGQNLTSAVTCPKCSSDKITRILSVFGFRIDGKFHHSEGYVKPDREGYHPDIDDPPTEIKSDLKRLEETKLHSSPQKCQKIDEAIKFFQFAHKDVL